MVDLTRKEKEMVDRAVRISLLTRLKSSSYSEAELDRLIADLRKRSRGLVLRDRANRKGGNVLQEMVKKA